MTLLDFESLIKKRSKPVVLVEGRRKIPKDDYQKLVGFTGLLARNYPSLKFRTGNAEGADRAFAEGVAHVDESRIEYVVPYDRHRLTARYGNSASIALDDVWEGCEQEIVYKTTNATPQVKRMIRDSAPPSVRAKANYLFRDTLKVTGFGDEFDPPVAGIFYVNLNDVMSGGTGHTIRVCRNEGLPCIFQDGWFKWFEGPGEAVL